MSRQITTEHASIDQSPIPFFSFSSAKEFSGRDGLNGARVAFMDGNYSQ